MTTNTDGIKTTALRAGLAEDGVSRRRLIKLTGAGTAVLGLSGVAGMATAGAANAAPGGSRPALEPGDTSNGADNFYISDQVTVRKISFKNQYQMKVVGNLFVPNTLDRRLSNPALVIGHPMGAVKEQSANLYATKMAEQGFVTCRLTSPSGERAPVSQATPLPRTSTPRTSAPRSTTSAVLRGQGTSGCHRYLRQRKLRSQRGKDRSADQSHRHCEYA
ncbi:alpha/beta hydrolase [Micrococcaceae bacterium Sec5.1]